MKNNEKVLIVVAYEWPNDFTGGGIALKSSLSIYKLYYEKILFLGCTESPPGQLQDETCVDYVHIPVKKEGISVRFIKSIPSRWPGIALQFTGKFVVNKVNDFVNITCDKYEDVSIIFEHLAPSVLLHLCPSMERVRKIGFRSFDVLQVAFDGVKNSSRFPMKLAWKLEILKIRNLENRTIKKSVFWSISESDARDYSIVNNIVDGVFGVSIDVEKYDNVAAGGEHVAIYLGGIDARKQSGISLLVEEVWPEVRKKYCNARLVIGGVGSDYLSDEANGICGNGFVNDELGFLGLGKIFINPQTGGSGVKLKSLHAMAARKCLISFDNGVKGIDGVSGKHFIKCTDAKHMIEQIMWCFEHAERCAEIGESARKYVLENYSNATLVNSTQTLMRDFSGATE